MRKILPLVFFALLCIMIPIVLSEPSMSLDLEPRPQYSQVWAYETNKINITIPDFELSDINYSGYTGLPSGLLIDGNINWRGKGGYDFGEATTGYNFYLDELTVTKTASLDTDSVLLNFTIEKDAFEYGRLPFETIEINFSFDIHVFMSDMSIGPKITSISQSFVLVDQTKVSYLQGKYHDMQDEILEAIEGLGLESLNREKYIDIMETMNNSLSDGNYVEALDVWIDYDTDYRYDLLNDLISASDFQYIELENLHSIETQLQETENQLSIAHIEYSQLENAYNALSKTYRKVNADLDIAKRNLSTAITAVFLTAIVFYFLGRGSIRRVDVERLDELSVH